MSLDTYLRKRDFSRTPEPQGRARKRRAGLSFVVQKHDARRLHYDFRLELDGVLKSWAVTRGPSLVPGEKRLAVHVEDHPLDYGDFEGTIPKGEYGGGTVIVWDRGQWKPIGDPEKGLAKGHLEFELSGQKLAGRWHLVRMAQRPREKRENWLLIKGEDDKARTRLLQAVGLSGFAATNIMLLSVSVWSGADAATRDLFHWISAAIAAPTLIYAGRFFYASAWNALKRGRTNMDVPIALAITLSYAVSLWETIHHGEHAWFDATVTLLFFLLIGRTLDHVMRNRARSAITGLARLVPRGATVLNDDGQRRYMPVEEIAVGDRIALTAGERVPVDATVISGASDVYMSIVTGESRPVAVSVGSELKSGAMNLTGSLTVRAVATARDSLLSEIIGLM